MLRFQPCPRFKSQKGTSTHLIFSFHITIPLCRYRVPKLEGLAVGRHPIYGTSLKRIDVKTESDESLEPAKKKKKRRKSVTDDNLGEPLSSVKEEPDNVEEPKKMKKKKKDKKE